MLSASILLIVVLILSQVLRECINCCTEITPRKFKLFNGLNGFLCANFALSKEIYYLTLNAADFFASIRIE